MYRQSTALCFAAVTTTVLMVATLGGCPWQPDNNAPRASAGAYQTVGAGTTVSLSALGSSDADDDTLFYAWFQTAGMRAVALNGATTATPNFTAPDAPDTLTFRVTVNDGHGGTNAATVQIDVQAEPPVVTPQLFITNVWDASVTSYRNPSQIAGNVIPNTHLTGRIGQPRGIVVDAMGALLVADGANCTVTAYDGAANLSGNVEPSRRLRGALTLLTGPTALAIDAVSDLLFVANNEYDGINVYANASTSALNGDAAPTRRILSTALASPSGMCFGANDDLYVANWGDGNVLVFAHAGTLNGSVLPARTLTLGPTFYGPSDVFVDNADRLYVLSRNGYAWIFDNASSLDGGVTPTGVLTIPDVEGLAAIAVDSAGIGYISDYSASAVYVYDNIAARNGTLVPDRTIQGDQTQLGYPLDVFLVE